MRAESSYRVSDGNVPGAGSISPHVSRSRTPLTPAKAAKLANAAISLRSFSTVPERVNHAFAVSMQTGESAGTGAASLLTTAAVVRAHALPPASNPSNRYQPTGSDSTSTVFVSLPQTPCATLRPSASHSCQRIPSLKSAGSAAVSRSPSTHTLPGCSGKDAGTPRATDSAGLPKSAIAKSIHNPTATFAFMTTINPRLSNIFWVSVAHRASPCPVEIEDGFLAKKTRAPSHEQATRSR